MLDQESAARISTISFSLVKYTVLRFVVGHVVNSRVNFCLLNSAPVDLTFKQEEEWHV